MKGVISIHFLNYCYLCATFTKGETVVRVSRGEQRHLGWAFLPYHWFKSAPQASQITFKAITVCTLSHSTPLITAAPDCNVCPHMGWRTGI